MPVAPVEVSLIGRVLDEDQFSRTGVLLLPKGTVLTGLHIYKLLRQNIHYVKVREQTPPPVGSGEGIFQQLQSLDGDRETIACYLQAFEGTKQLFERVTEESAPSLDEFSRTFEPVVTQVLKDLGMFRSLYVLDGADSYTFRHSINVGILSALIARLIKWDEKKVAQMAMAGFLHDIGKMLVPKEILLKPGRLTPAEYETMKLHTVFGEQLIRRMEGGNEVFANCALYHHERLDGSGYPKQLKGDAIPLECQVIAVADTFDAICSDRVYKRRTSPFEAAQVLWSSACDGLLNIEIVASFVYYIVMLYVGSKAVLNTGEEVEVVLVHRDEPMRPLVRLHEQFVDLRHNRNLTIEKMIL
jgi:HD-GYP domain-containing protein (c-di-GMP phosphodiesterase class II)